MNNKEFLVLIEKIHAGTASEEELKCFEQWYAGLEQPAAMWEGLQDIPSRFEAELLARITDKIDKPAERRTFRIVRKWLPLVAAACLFLIFSASLYFLFSPEISRTDQQVQIDSAVHSGLMLSVGQGQEMDLTDSEAVAKATVATGIQVTQNSDGSYVCTLPKIAEKTTESASEKQHTLTTSYGQVCQVVLADGTKVWLNARSSLRFPRQFTGSERRVFLEGEGYFEVAKNVEKTFFVQSAAQELRVTGTHFNVECYLDGAHSATTTLLEGGVSIQREGTAYQLKPGMQLQLLGDGVGKIKQVDTREAVAWKEGIFIFNNERFATIAQRLSRWYGVEFDTAAAPQVMQQVFSGTVTRFDRVEDVLDVLAQTGGIRFKKEGRRVVLMN